MSEHQQEHKSEYTSKQLKTFLRDDRFDKILAADPKFVTKRDENGQTIMHHAVLSSSSKVFYKRPTLFANEHLDLNIQDNEGRTPLHCAFTDGVTISSWMLAYLLQEAQKRNTNFEILDNAGFSIYHYVFRYRDNDCRYYSRNLFDTINASIKNPNWNVLSKKGTTPFFYALKRFDCKQEDIESIIHQMLEQGADPLLCNSEERSPLTWIERTSDILAEAPFPSVYYAVNNTLNNIADKIEASTKEKVQKVVHNSIQEVVKTSSGNVPEPVSGIIMSYFYPRSVSGDSSNLAESKDTESSMILL